MSVGCAQGNSGDNYVKSVITRSGCVLKLEFCASLPADAQVLARDFLKFCGENRLLARLVQPNGDQVFGNEYVEFFTASVHTHVG